MRRTDQLAGDEKKIIDFLQQINGVTRGQAEVLYTNYDREKIETLRLMIVHMDIGGQR